jgi:predicted nuclease of restriction endonuclease-like (RecB) superfamily
MIKLYWQIGVEILERQNLQGWGSKVIERLAGDLRREFPEIKGFSPSNLKYMRRFAEDCPNCQIGQQPVDQLPWRIS